MEQYICDRMDTVHKQGLKRFQGCEYHYNTQQDTLVVVALHRNIHIHIHIQYIYLFRPHFGSLPDTPCRIVSPLLHETQRHIALDLRLHLNKYALEDKVHISPLLHRSMTLVYKVNITLTPGVNKSHSCKVQDQDLFLDCTQSRLDMVYRKLNLRSLCTFPLYNLYITH